MMLGSGSLDLPCGATGYSSSSSSSSSDLSLSSLCRHLIQERLYVTSEKCQLEVLHGSVASCSSRVAHTAWVAHQQRTNLQRLLAGAGTATPAAAMQNANRMDRAKFEDAYKHLSYQEILYSEFLRALRDKPQFLASCLSAGDALGLPSMSLLGSTLFSGVFGCCLMPEDEQAVLRLLHHLMEAQLVPAANPRKLLRQGNCSFTRLYKAFSEELFSAKLFLTSALYEPILNLLSDDEIFLDIDPSKAIIRFPPAEREAKFGAEGSAQYETAMKEHRTFIIGKLVALTNAFIAAIRKNLHCFPPSLARLLRAMYMLMSSSEGGRKDPKEVKAVCVDVIFDLFLCPAMVDPNPVGIIDTPISYIARSNLMQVAQILQVLTLWKWDEIDPKLMDLYSRFDKEAMSSILEALLELGERAEEDLEERDESMESSDSLHGGDQRLSRLAALLTREQLEGLIQFLRTLETSDEEVLTKSGVDIVELRGLIQPLPASLPKEPEGYSAPQEAPHGEERSKPNQVKKLLASRISNAANTLHNAGKNLTANSHKSKSDVDDNSCSSEDNNSLSAVPPADVTPREPDRVLVIPLGDGGAGGGVLPGFLSEEHVLTRSRQAARVVRMNLDNLPGGGGGGGDGGVSGEKRTRFSLSHDGEGSIGNTSDNLEAISEASDHSDSSLEDDEVAQVEDPNNETLLNDLVSANVSGRGTPNVSGRDTPSSQVTEGEELAARTDEADQAAAAVEAEAAAEVQNREAAPAGPAAYRRPGAVMGAPVSRPLPRRAHPLLGGGGRKNGEPDLEEKFGRFEIKPPPRVVGTMSGGAGGEQGDETVSMVSDTWSTDVLASDTEGDGGRPPANLEDLLRQRNNADEASRNRLLDELSVPAAAGSSSSSNLLDVAETASEAWSMDVLASDSESLRLGELDNEDAASVARSDDTRFTDDTTRSDPEPLLEGGVGGIVGANPGMVAVRGRDDVTLNKRSSGPGPEAGGSLFRPSRAAAVEQWARQSSGGGKGGLVSTLAQGQQLGLVRRGSDSSGIGGAKRVDGGSILKKSFSTTSPATSHQQHPTATPVQKTKSAGASSEEASHDAAVSQLSSNMSVASIASSTESSAEGAEGVKSRSADTKSGVVGGGGGLVASSSASLLDSDNPPFNAASGSAGRQGVAAGGNGAALASSTGAIPKSISFDKTVYDNGGAPLGHLEEGKHGKAGGSFFKSWKLPKIGRNRGGGAMGASSSRMPTSSSQGAKPPGDSAGDFGTLIDLGSSSSLSDSQQLLRRAVSEETTDDILAKYRKKSSASHTDSLPDSTASVPDTIDGAFSEDTDERLIMDPNNLEASYAFQDAKRKLRLMLAEADLNALSHLPKSKKLKKEKRGKINGDVEGEENNGPDSECNGDNEIVVFLRVQLAEAHNLQDRNLVAQLHETLRCLSLFDADGCRKLLRSLREDYKRRSPYLTYLVRCRQGLLAMLSHQQKLLSRMEVDQRVCSQYLISVVVRLFLEKREIQMQRFIVQFKECSAADEKITLMENFLQKLWTEMEEDASWALVGSEDQMALGRLSIERSVVSQIYMFALYPNGDGDISRDEVLSQHIRKLAKVISPSHKDLKISRQFHYEQPWPSAQAEIRRLAAYKTPSDKVACVLRCCQTIMNLLSLASAGKSVPAADDFVPVMVFVLIKANPPSLLSTVQYVDSFYGSRLSGEDQYWWMQFAAAIEFIKTMDYRT